MKISEIRKKLGLMNNKKFIRKSRWEMKVRERLNMSRNSGFEKYMIYSGIEKNRQTGRSTEIILKVLKKMSEGHYVIFAGNTLSAAQQKIGTIRGYARILGIDDKLLLKAIGKDYDNYFLAGINKSIKIIYDHNLP